MCWPAASPTATAASQAWRFVREHWDHATATFPNNSIDPDGGSGEDAHPARAGGRRRRRSSPSTTSRRPRRHCSRCSSASGSTSRCASARPRARRCVRVTPRPDDSPVEVFAVEPAAAQLVVRSRRARPITVHVGEQESVVDTRRRDRRRRRRRARARDDATRFGSTDGGRRACGPSPSRPAGYLGRFATVSDLHIGETGFGRAPRLHLSPRPGHRPSGRLPAGGAGGAAGLGSARA